jgi:hypothetical protein
VPRRSMASHSDAEIATNTLCYYITVWGGVDIICTTYFGVKRKRILPKMCLSISHTNKYKLIIFLNNIKYLIFVPNTKCVLCSLGTDNFQEGIKRRLNSGNACYHSIQNLLSSRLLSKYVNIRICKSTILSVVLYGCETRSLTLKEEHRLRCLRTWCWGGYLDYRVASQLAASRVVLSSIQLVVNWIPMYCNAGDIH